MLRPFEILTPDTLAAASALLSAGGDDAGLYAGGTELLLVMKAGLRHYQELIDLKPLPGLRKIDWMAESGTLVIGATTTHREAELSPIVKQHLPILAEMERSLANIRVRTQGTLGGNLCFAEPHSDPATLLLALDARVVLFSEQKGTRVLPLQDFILDAYSTALDTGEILIQIEIPCLPAGAGTAYKKFALYERPTVGVAAAVVFASDGTIADARIAIGCVGPKPTRMAPAEELLRRAPADGIDAALTRAAAVASAAADAIDDLHGSAEYKRHLVGVFLRRAVEQAIERSQANQDRS